MIIVDFQARYIDETDRILSNDQQRLFAVNSYSGAYLQLSTSTFSPKVKLNMNNICLNNSMKVAFFCSKLCIYSVNPTLT